MYVLYKHVYTNHVRQLYGKSSQSPDGNIKLWEEVTFYFNELKCHVSFKQDHRPQIASVLNEKGESVCNINQTP